MSTEVLSSEEEVSLVKGYILNRNFPGLKEIGKDRGWSEKKLNTLCQEAMEEIGGSKLEEKVFDSEAFSRKPHPTNRETYYSPKWYTTLPEWLDTRLNLEASTKRSSE